MKKIRARRKECRKFSWISLKVTLQFVAYHRQVLEDLKNQNVGQDEINRQVAEVRAAEDFQQRTVKMNNQVERQAEYGAIGSVASAALGSAVPGIGTAIGGIIGGILGDYLDTKAADLVNQTENNAQQHSGNSTSFLDVGNQGIAEHGAEMREYEDALRNYGNNVARRRAADEEERQLILTYRIFLEKLTSANNFKVCLKESEKLTSRRCCRTFRQSVK